MIQAQDHDSCLSDQTRGVKERPSSSHNISGPILLCRHRRSENDSVMPLLKRESYKNNRASPWLEFCQSLSSVLPLGMSQYSKFSSQPTVGTTPTTVGAQPSTHSPQAASFDNQTVVPAHQRAMHSHSSPASRQGSLARAFWDPYDPYAGPLPPELEGAVRHEVRVQLTKLEEEYARRIVEVKKEHYLAHSKMSKGDAELESAHEKHTNEIKAIVDEYKEKVKMLHSTEQDVSGECRRACLTDGSVTNMVRAVERC